MVWGVQWLHSLYHILLYNYYKSQKYQREVEDQISNAKNNSSVMFILKSSKFCSFIITMSLTKNAKGTVNYKIVKNKNARFSSKCKPHNL